MRVAVALISGLILGFLSAVIVELVAPEILVPYTREFVPAEQMESIKGTVEKKQRDGTRLLLTLSTSKGVLLATFTKKIDELDLLIADGYAVTIKLRSYSPFVDNPKVERVEANAGRQKVESPSPSSP
jgi:hypothetical protein